MDEEYQPLFFKEGLKKTKLIAFRVSPKLHEEFRAEVKKNHLRCGPVVERLMQWFVQQSVNGKLKVTKF